MFTRKKPFFSLHVATAAFVDVFHQSEPPQRNPLIYATDFYTPLPIPPIGAKMITLLLVWQDATLRGAKDDLNLKENKTNTSRKKLKKGKRKEETTKTTTAKTTKSHRECSLQT
jgi:hypothetical protein